jgi:hypothetical protein
MSRRTRLLRGVASSLLALALAAAGTAGAAQEPPELAQADEPERIVVTAPPPWWKALVDNVVDCVSQQADMPEPRPSARVRFRLNRDGTLKGAPAVRITEDGLDADDPRSVRAAAAVEQAIYDCEPYDYLPQDRYRRWRRLQLNFLSHMPEP